MTSPFDAASPRPTPPLRCRSIGAIIARGEEVGAVRCVHDAGHDVDSCVLRYPHPCALEGYTGADGWACAPLRATPHAYTLEWTDTIRLEPYDPDETFDVEIPVDGH
jgi:hypothetical protein